MCVDMIMCFCLLLMQCIILIDLCMLSHTCKLGMNPTWSFVWSFLCVFGFGLLILCWEFLHLYSSKILACNFLFWYYHLSGCGCQGDYDFIECLWEFSLLFNSLKRFEKDQNKHIILNVFGRIYLWSPFWPWTCL